MNDYLGNLAARSLNLAPVLQPRPLALFEPQPATAWAPPPTDLSLERVEAEPSAAQPAAANPPVAQGSERAEPLTTRAFTPAPYPTAARPPLAPGPEPSEPVTTQAFAPTPYLTAARPPVAEGPEPAEPMPPQAFEFGPAVTRSPRPEAPHAAAEAAPPGERGLTASTFPSPIRLEPQPEPAADHPNLPEAFTPPGPLEPAPIPGYVLARPRVVRVAPASPPEAAPLEPRTYGRRPGEAQPVDLAPSPPAPSAPPETLGLNPPRVLPPPPTGEGPRTLRPLVRQAQPPEPASPPQPSTVTPEPVVQVTIGRIEVHVAATAKPRREAPSRTPALTLADYLQQYGGKR